MAYGVCFEFINPVSFPYGRSRQGTDLDPYYSSAVNNEDIVNGTKLYIELLDGVEMPGTEGGFTHDGCVIADDTGVDQAVISFFVYRQSNYTTLNETL